MSPLSDTPITDRRAPPAAPAPDLAVPPDDAEALRIGGITPFTSIDFPDHLSAVVFLQGCPWRCHYCHNPHLQSPEPGPEAPRWHDLRVWLQRRAGLLDGVVFSGGEPTLDPALPAAMAEVKAMGLAVGLHTAGLSPRRLQALLPLVDWVGMDVKSPLSRPAQHDRLVRLQAGTAALLDSVKMVLASGVACEFRTTAHPQWLPDADLLLLAGELAALGATHYAVQRYRPVKGDDAAPPAAGDHYPAPDTLRQLEGMFPHFILRG